MGEAGMGTFSILERIDVGETTRLASSDSSVMAFSILERIDVGETREGGSEEGGRVAFQYPRTDRRG